MSTRRFSKGRNGLYLPSYEPPSGPQPFFTETFAGGQFNEYGGFDWQASTNISFVTFESRTCLRFNYAPATPSSEQRWYAGVGRDMSEFAMEWWLHIPANYDHLNLSPNNNKFIQLWRDTYSDVSGGTFRTGIETVTDVSTTPNSDIRFMASRWDSNSNDSSGMGMPNNFTPFIGGTGPALIGDWNRFRYYFKASTDRTTSDGIIRFWVGDTLHWEQTNGKFNNFFDTPTGCYIRRGYFMGSTNADFGESTPIHMTDVSFWDQDPEWALV